MLNKINKQNASKNLYKEEWEKIEKTREKPYNYNKIICIEHNEFISKIFEQDPSFIKKTVEHMLKNFLFYVQFHLIYPFYYYLNLNHFQ